ncbi:hypothetical protein KOR42_44120 [Thalassoglobus neptunius]|uniref:DnaJ homologue subfamily C member 28 conserved domain-containing protein n=1 Tax=Thalassoglobus neptunius TaxID=1938619 RepID=A0A5C5VYW0_9PLAN|nr:DUF1992 domain-containing protein [Thalassoglobus neptunius]TWT43594.1 hypothetical protein KOR42_44120 [Thalassoglobus neptunius]
MGERKPAHQPWEGFIEQRIQDAQSEGEFDNLSGHGKPISGVEKVLESDWWLKDKLKREQLSIVPPLIDARRDIEQTLNEIKTLANEDFVRAELEKLNQRVLQAIQSPSPSPPIVVVPVNIEREIARWKESKNSGAQST